MSRPAGPVVADDRTNAAAVHRLALRGTAVLWRGDWHQARQVLAALGRRADRAAPPLPPGASAAEAFAHHRRVRAERARVLNRLLVPLTGDHRIALRRAPDVRAACAAAYGPPGPAGASREVPLRELLGVVGAYQWYLRGVPVPALGGDRVHPWYGVFAPVRGEYVDLVAAAPLPRGGRVRTAFDLGTGTGVLAAVLARRGVARVVATDASERALACARDNAARLGLAARVHVEGPALFPAGTADLVVCNPPWLPGRPVSALDAGVHDPDSRMLRGFLAGLAGHLAPGGEGWLILSDLAERVGLRSPHALAEAFEGAGLRVVDRLTVRPRHRRAREAAGRPGDPLQAARAAEITSLWRLAPRARGR